MTINKVEGGERQGGQSRLLITALISGILSIPVTVILF